MPQPDGSDARTHTSALRSIEIGSVDCASSSWPSVGNLLSATLLLDSPVSGEGLEKLCRRSGAGRITLYALHTRTAAFEWMPSKSLNYELHNSYEQCPSSRNNEKKFTEKSSRRRLEVQPDGRNYNELCGV